MLKSIIILKGAFVMALGFGQSAWACSPNLPNYGNCLRQQQQAHQMQQRYQAMQQRRTHRSNPTKSIDGQSPHCCRI